MERVIADVAELAAMVRASTALRVRGAGTKAPLWRAPPTSATLLDLAALAGIVEYDPGELVITARAGTTVVAAQRVLAEQAQCLPFDPLLAQTGATLGGTVAAGTAGSGRLRYGGLRDFLIGVQLVDGEGNVVRGGARVVKNAAGFDLPKLMVGSRGRLGVLTELSFKVFPRPRSMVTLTAGFGDSAAAAAAFQRSTLSFDLSSADLVLGPAPARLWLRLGGQRAATLLRARRVFDWLAAQDGSSEPRLVDSALAPAEEESCWQETRELSFVPEGSSLLKLPCTSRGVEAIERALPAVAGGGWPRRYLAGGAMALLCVPDALPGDRLAAFLGRVGPIQALVLRGNRTPALLCCDPQTTADRPFADRVARALDPRGVFAVSPAGSGERGGSPQDGEDR